MSATLTPAAPTPSQSKKPRKPKPKTPRKAPGYRHHKPSGRAVVTLDGKDHWLGKYGTPESVQKYDRLIQQWLSNGRELVEEGAPPDITVNEMVLKFWHHAEQYYRRPDGTPTGEAENYKYAVRPVVKLFGFEPAVSFRQSSLELVRDKLIRDGASRTYINDQVGRIVRVFRWAASKELIPASVPASLETLMPLARGKTEARETEAVKAVPQPHVEKVIPFMAPPIAAMVKLQLLDFGREREGIDLSKVVLTHHTLRNLGKRTLALNKGENPKLEPITETGGGSVREKQRALLDEIIRKVNELFEGELTDQDKLVYVNDVIKGKLLESETLKQQAASNTKEQFANSPDLKSELMNAIIEALDAHQAMSKQALDSEQVRDGLRDVLLGPAKLYEALRPQGRSVP